MKYRSKRILRFLIRERMEIFYWLMMFALLLAGIAILLFSIGESLGCLADAIKRQ